MSDPSVEQPIPRMLLAGAASLVAFTVIAVVFVRITGIGTSHSPDARPVEVRELIFHDRRDGGIDVFEADGNQLVDVVAPESNGFLRGTLRGLARERFREGGGPEQPFRLTRTSDGRLLLDDPATGRQVDLAAFGSTNAEAFARFMSPAHRMN